METLPHELLVQIALYLPPIEAVSLSLLSKHFRKVACFDLVSFAQKSLKGNRLCEVKLSVLPPSFCAAFVLLYANSGAKLKEAVASVGSEEHLSFALSNRLKTLSRNIAKHALFLAANSGSVSLAKTALELSEISPDCVPKCLCLRCQSCPDLPDEADEGPTPTALGIAAHLGHLDLISFLLSLGADVDSIGSDLDRKYCPVNLATQGGHSQALQLLLEHGADPNFRDYGEWTSLHWAAEAGRIDLCSILLKYGAIVDAADQQNRTSLHWSVSKGMMDVVEFLVNQKANIHVRTSSDTTLVHLAAANGHLRVLEYLISIGCFVDALDGTNRTPLHSACDDGHADVCVALIKSGVNFNTPDIDGYSALHVAVSNAHRECVQVLLDRGASLITTTRDGNTSLHLAASTDNVELIQMIERYWKKVAGPEACHQLHLMENNSHHTPLHYACCFGYEKAADHLLGNTPAATFLDPSTNSPLHLAIRFGHFNTMQTVLQFITDKYAGQATQALLDSALDFTIECFLSLRPYNSSIDRDFARILVAKDAHVTLSWELQCAGGCGKMEIASPFYKCMLCDIVYCGDCRERARNEVGFHPEGHGFLVGDKLQVLDFLLGLER